MEITEAIRRADAFYPNSYTREEKLAWCYELTCMIAEKVKKLYAAVELDGGEGAEFVLPPSVAMEDIDRVYADGRELVKTDERSFLPRLSQALGRPGKIRVVYKIRPEPYHENVFEGTYSVSGTRITARDAWFRTGDTVRVVHDGTGEERCVCEVDGDDYVFGGEAFGFQGSTPLRLEEVLTALTPPPPPWDSMYVDYLLGKVAYYQNDIDEYNKHMSEYNAKLSDYEKHYKQTNPIQAGLRFRRVW